MSYFHAFIVALIFLTHACGPAKRDSGSKLASEGGVCEIRDRDINERCEGSQTNARGQGEIERQYHGNVREVVIDKDGAKAPHLEMTMIVRYNGPAPEAGFGLTHEARANLGQSAGGVSFPKARPEVSGRRENYSGGIEQVKQENTRLRKEVQDNLVADAQLIERGRSGFSDAMNAAMSDHNAAAASIAEANGLSASTTTSDGWAYQVPRDTPAGRRIEQVSAYRDHVASEVAKDQSSAKEVRAKLVGMADVSIALADDSYYGKSEAAGDFYLKTSLRFLDVALSFTPGLGTAYDVVQLVTGTNIAGDMLSESDRAIIGATIFLPTIMASSLRATLKSLDAITHIAPDARSLAKLLEGAEPAVRTLESYGVPARSTAFFLRIAHAMSGVPGGYKMARIHMGAGNGRVAVIGRGMDVVEPTGKHLGKAGFKAETFVPSDTAREEFIDKLMKYKEEVDKDAKRLPYELVKETQMFTENRAWIEKMKREGISIVDMGDPTGKSAAEGASAFYDIEKQIIFGDKMQ